MAAEAAADLLKSEGDIKEEAPAELLESAAAAAEGSQTSESGDSCKRSVVVTAVGNGVEDLNRK